MKAAVIDAYGPPGNLYLRDMEEPRIKDDQLLVAVRASSVNPIDWKIRVGMLKWLLFPKFPLILGFDICGEVVEIGASVTKFKKGDRIYAKLEPATGGAYAEFAAVGEKAAALAPKNASDEEAAAIPLAAMTALQGMRDDGRLKAGSRVLVVGASGGVGSYAVQIAKSLGVHVTAVCGTGNIPWVKELGADRIIDYKEEDVLETPEPYDVVFDAVATQSFFRVRKVLKSGGAFVSTLPNAGLVLSIAMTKILPGKKARFILVRPAGNDLTYLAGLFEAKKLKSAIDSTFALAEIQKAHERSESQRAKGKIVVRIR